MPDPSWNNNQDCDAFDLGWSAQTAGGGSGSCTLVTKDSRSVYRCEALTNLDQGFAVNTTLTAWTQGTFEFTVKHDNRHTSNPTGFIFLRDSALNAYNLDYFHFVAVGGVTPYRIVRARSGVDTVTTTRFWYDTKVSGESDFDTFRIVIDGSKVMHIWHKNVDGTWVFLGTHAYGSGVQTGFTTNTFGVVVQGDGTQKDAWYDDLKSSTTKEEPDQQKIIQLNGLEAAGMVTHLANPWREGNVSWDIPELDNEELRFNRKNAPSGKTNTVYSIPIGSTLDGVAFSDRLRIRDGSNTKGIALNPLF